MMLSKTREKGKPTVIAYPPNPRKRIPVDFALSQIGENIKLLKVFQRTNA